MTSQLASKVIWFWVFNIVMVCVLMTFAVIAIFADAGANEMVNLSPNTTEPLATLGICFITILLNLGSLAMAVFFILVWFGGMWVLFGEDFSSMGERFVAAYRKFRNLPVKPSGGLQGTAVPLSSEKKKDGWL